MTMLTQEVRPTESGRWRWTRDDCLFMERAGLIKGRYELIDGEVVSKMGQHPPHAFTVVQIILYLVSVFGRRRVRSQATIEIWDKERVINQPEPDAVALREESMRVPTGEEIALAVEVSDTTLSYDLGAKVGLYARAGIEEYWVLDINRRVLIALRHPEGSEWREWQEYSEDSRIAPLSAPDAFVRVGDLLPSLMEEESAE